MTAWKILFDVIKYAGGSVAIAYLLFTWLGKRVVTCQAPIIYTNDK